MQAILGSRWSYDPPKNLDAAHPGEPNMDTAEQIMNMTEREMRAEPLDPASPVHGTRDAVAEEDPPAVLAVTRP